MRRVLLISFILFLSPLLHAHTISDYVNTREGITLFSVVTKGAKEEMKMMDGFLARIVEQLKRRDKSIPVYIYLDQFTLCNRKQHTWFGAIAYDTLKRPDNNFLYSYFEYRMGQEYRDRLSNKSSQTSLKYQADLPEPLDLYASYKDIIPLTLGLKVLYNYDQSDTTDIWDRVFSLVQYAVDHVDAIKTQQQRIVIPFDVTIMEPTNYKPLVSFLTIDTLKIRNIPLLPLHFDMNHPYASKERTQRIWMLFGSVALFLLALTIVINKSRPRQD